MAPGKVHGQGCSLYRASDRDGTLVDSVHSAVRQLHYAAIARFSAARDELRDGFWPRTTEESLSVAERR